MQFPPLPVASAEKLSKRNCGPSEFRTDGPAQKLVLVEDADFGHVPRVEAQRYGFPNVRRERRRNVAETLEVNAIHSHLSRLGHLNQQQVQLLQGVRHLRQEAVSFPAFNGQCLRFGVFPAVVHVQ